MNAGQTGSLRRTAEIVLLASILLLAPLEVLAQVGGGYAGPSLLSRGGNTPGRRGNAPVSFTYYGALRGMYESGVIAPVLDERGELNGVTLQGVQAELGAYGAKSWRRSSIGLDYRGDYRKTSPDIKSYNGTNQALSLDYTYQPTARMQIFVREEGGTTNRAFGGFSAPAFVNQQNPGIPTNEVFDARVYFNQTTGGVSYRKSARTQFTAEGVGFFIKRTHSLISVQGYEAGGSVIHQLSRSHSIGARYDFIRFEYPKVYGGSDIHMLSLLYNRRMNRAWSIKLEVGAYEANTVGTQLVQLSPEIAAILGRETGLEAFDRTVVKPRVEATSSLAFKRSSWSTMFTSGPGAGNGVYTTSNQTSIHSGYSYAGFRKLSFGASAGYTKFDSLAVRIRKNYTTFQAGGGANYKLARHLDLSLQVDQRHFSAPGVPGRSGVGIALGLAYSPASIPLSIW